MELFDAHPHDLQGPRTNAQSSFDFLNRSSRPEPADIRRVFEGWFSHYPADQQNDFRSRFRSKKDREHRAAAFELTLHELARRTSRRITVHPEPDWQTSKRPDFQVEPAEGSPFLLEAIASAGQSGGEAQREGLIAVLLDRIDQMDSPNFFIKVGVDGTPGSTPRAKWIIGFLKDKLRDLDPDEVARQHQLTGELPEWRYDLDGATLIFAPIPKSPEARGKAGVRTLGTLSGEAVWVDAVTPLREALRDKAQKYGGPPRPLVVAVNSLDLYLEPGKDIRQALFGSERTGVRVTGEVVKRHSRDGLWLGNEGPRYRNVSAVLMVYALVPWTVGVARARLFLNPWAIHQLAHGLEELPNASVKGEELVYRDGRSIADLLGLPERWPTTSAFAGEAERDQPE